MSVLSDGFESETIVEQVETLIEKLSEIISPIQSKKMRDLNEISENLLDYYSIIIQEKSKKSRIDATRATLK